MGRNRNPPSRDVFSTLDNHPFHASIPYTTLKAGKKGIRLMQLLPNDGSGIIKCVLKQRVPLFDVQGQYTAISYRAGDPTRTDSILVDGMQFNVLANLGHALAEIQHFWEKTYNGRICSYGLTRSALIRWMFLKDHIKLDSCEISTSARNKFWSVCLLPTVRGKAWTG